MLSHVLSEAFVLLGNDFLTTFRPSGYILTRCLSKIVNLTLVNKSRQVVTNACNPRCRTSILYRYWGSYLSLRVVIHIEGHHSSYVRPRALDSTSVSVIPRAGQRSGRCCNLLSHDSTRGHRHSTKHAHRKLMAVSHKVAFNLSTSQIGGCRSKIETI